MYFKQLSVFRLHKNLEKSALEESLKTLPFRPCNPQERFSEGFIQPSPFDNGLVYDAYGHDLVSLKKEEKVLPNAVIKEALNKKIAVVEAAQNRNVGRKEQKKLKEDITRDLLPQAMVKSSRTNAFLTGGWVLVDNASPAKSENLIKQLIEATQAKLRTSAALTKKSPTQLMTEWVFNGEADYGFELDYDITMRSNGDKPEKVKISNKSATDGDVVQHVENGMRVVELGLVWENKIAFILTEDFTLKRIRYFDVLVKKAEAGNDTAADVFLATQILMAESLRGLVNDLVVCLGGLKNN